MVRKTIWMLVLAFGILNSFYSCNKTIDKSFYEEYIYKNNSGHNLTIKAFNKTDNGYISNSYTLPANGNFSQEIELISGSKIGIIALCDSVAVQFGNDRISFFLPETESSYNIIAHNNYDCIEEDENHRICTYIFTSEDYENADEL